MSTAARFHRPKNGERDVVTCDNLSGGRNTKGANALDPKSLRDVIEGALREKKSELSASRHRKIRENIGKVSFALDLSHRNKLEPGNDVHTLNAPAAGLDVLGTSPMEVNSVTMTNTKGPPSGLSWVRLHRNMMVTERYAHDFFVPYLGETEAELKSSNELAAVLEPDGSSEEDDSDVELMTNLDERAGRTVVGGDEPVKKKSSEMRAQRDKLVSLNGSRFQCKVSAPVWDRAIKRVALKAVLEISQYSVTDIMKNAIRDIFKVRSVQQVDAYIKCVQGRVKAWEERDKECRTQNIQMGQILRLARKVERTSASVVLKSMSIPYFICRQCHTFCCVMHGVQDVKPSVEPVDKTRKDMGSKQFGEEIEDRCEDKANGNCYCQKTEQDRDECAEWAAGLKAREAIWCDVNAILSEAFSTFGNDPCRLSSLVRTLLPKCHSDVVFTCRRIGTLFENLFQKQCAARAVESNRMKSIAKRGGKKSTKGQTRPPQSASEAMKRGKHIDYSPCYHEGECTKSVCTCVQNGILCEKYCGCNHARCLQDRTQITCHRAFAGCQCKSSAACVTNSCICWSQGRECDPDRCRSCCDCKENFTGERLRWGCRNVGLRMNFKQRTYAGHSDVHGWGVFAAADIQKSEIIGEYVAEVIQQTDAEQRGRVYDETRYSFLFDITHEQALDSTRLGNKLRFCNHSSNPNCEPKVMRVGGDVRVGIYAKRDIAKNEELFFDYGYHKDLPFKWAQEGKEISPTRKKRGISSRTKSCNDDSDSDAPPVDHKRFKPERRSRRLVANGDLNGKDEFSDVQIKREDRSSPDTTNESSDQSWTIKEPSDIERQAGNGRESRYNRRRENGVMLIRRSNPNEKTSEEELKRSSARAVKKRESVSMQGRPAGVLERGAVREASQENIGRSRTREENKREPGLDKGEGRTASKSHNVRRRPRKIVSDDSEDEVIESPVLRRMSTDQRLSRLEERNVENHDAGRKRKRPLSDGLGILQTSGGLSIMHENGRLKKRGLSHMAGKMIARPTPPKNRRPEKPPEGRSRSENGKINVAGPNRINGKVTGSKGRGEMSDSIIVISDEEGQSSSVKSKSDAHPVRRRK